MYSHRRAVLHLFAKFRSNQSLGGRVKTSYEHIHFLKMAAGSHTGFDLGNVEPPTKSYCWSQLGFSNLVLILFTVAEILRFSYFAVLVEIAYSRPLKIPPHLKCVTTLPCEMSSVCRSVSLIAPLVSGVAGLRASSSSKADTLNI